MEELFLTTTSRKNPLSILCWGCVVGLLNPVCAFWRRNITVIKWSAGSAMPVCILEQSTAARRNVVTAITLDQRRSLRANSLALLCQLLNFDFICAVEVFLAINNLQTIVIVLFNQIPKLYSLRNLSRSPITIVLEIWGSQPLNA